MYLTDYRERCLKDVITQLEPGLFKKVTGLSVEDFNMLCSLGVFNAPLMNDAIFKFKRYEDASLTYTGLDKHADDEVGGWDTTIRKAEYERLFYNQQASMTEVDAGVYANPIKQVAKHEETFVDKKTATVVKMDSVGRTKASPVGIAAETPAQWSTTPAKKGGAAIPSSLLSSSAASATLTPTLASATLSASTAPTVPLDAEELLQKLETLSTGSEVLHKKFGIGKVERMDKSAKYLFVKFGIGEKKFIFPDAFLSGYLILP
jgi:hypothetical protein